MNQYFQSLFEPVKKYNGTVSEVVGDSMIAVWPIKKSETSHRIHACFAALDMVEAVRHFNDSNKDSPLPTRIGLHAGQMMIGNIGAMDRYEYNPFGDMVNTASRIEGLNKILGTRILASSEVVAELDAFLFREMGQFVLAGKSNPILVYELVCRKEDAGPQQKTLCAAFEKALHEYKNKNWEKGCRMFSELVKMDGRDGPSRFYLEQCKRLKDRPEEYWDGVININQK